MPSCPARGSAKLPNFYQDAVSCCGDSFMNATVDDGVRRGCIRSEKQNCDRTGTETEKINSVRGVITAGQTGRSTSYGPVSLRVSGTITTTYIPRARVAVSRPTSWTLPGYTCV